MKLFVTYGLVWFAMFAYVGADTKRCFCRAVLADNKSIVKDFGEVSRATHWLSVACRKLIDCPVVCDEKVKEWMCASQSECNNVTGGKKVVPSYQASTCSEGYGNNVRTCGCSFEKCMLECGTRTVAIELIKCMFDCHHQ